MKYRYTIIALILTFGSGMSISSYVLADSRNNVPAPITRTTIIQSNHEVVRTEILLDRTTSREDLISTCKFLADEGVQLTFESLTIRRAFFGILGKPRIAEAKGKIELSSGVHEAFEAGGIISFRAIKITYSIDIAKDKFFINMIEITD